MLGFTGPARPFAAAMGAVVLFARPAPAGPVTYSVLAYTGQAAPGLPGATFAALADPRLDDADRIVFWARLAGAGVTTSNDTSLWTNRAGPVTLLRREGDPVPGAPDFFVGFGTPAWNNLAQVALTGAVGSGAFSVPTTLAECTQVGLALTPVVRETAQVPVLGLLSYNDAGAAIYRTGDGAAIYSTRTGAVVAVARAGDPAPGASNAGAVFSVLGQPSHTVLGSAVFWASVTYAGQSVPESGIWSDEGGLHLVARTGQRAPEQAAGVLFAELDSTPRIASNGDVAFWARLSGPGVTAANDGSVWYAGPSGPHIQARKGTSAPVIPLVTVSDLARHVELADSGRLFFFGAVSGPGVTASNNSVIWQSDPLTGLDVVAREGDQAPELPDGVLFGVFGHAGVTATGRVAFITSLRGSGVTQSNSFALLASDGLADLRLVARTGDPFTVAPGDTRTVAQIGFDQGAAQSGYTQFSTGGFMVFRLAFTNGTAALVSAHVPLCLADVNNDGFVTGDDFDIFCHAFDYGEPAADVNGDGFVNGDDFDLFNGVFLEGC